MYRYEQNTRLMAPAWAGWHLAESDLHAALSLAGSQAERRAVRREMIARNGRLLAQRGYIWTGV